MQRTTISKLRPQLSQVITSLLPRNPAEKTEHPWTPNESGRPEVPAFTRRFRLEFSPRHFTPGGEWSSGTVDTAVELAVITDYRGSPELIEELAEDDWQDLRHALNAAKSPESGIIAVTYEGSPYVDPGEDGSLVQIAHTFELRYRARY
ncbi:hypothetical protein PPSIR1_06061 [Plesiocystis pacifica SIR-1]|uniref:Uncharacterized protein n=1 Tax=Plesiocystis pacifica SIR-1 TaxID=391625 RepID=A6G6T7_9BACT|nr:hypothetical protein [Plesiocystis pacifica]EDM78390.1 hypothetical protein PPSIR1_06061 [Plesiocystis pacifica SIR-1]